MELFYSKTISEGGRTLDADESAHCVRVLRHRRGDTIHVVDGHGMLYRCTIVDDDPRAVIFDIEEWVENYGSHDYWLRMAVCPPKNIDRFEWFAEKATEIGVDVISPLFGDYSERKVFKPERIERLLVKTDRFIEIELPAELSQTIKGDKLLYESYSISKNFSLSYKHNCIIITLYYKNLPDHFIKYIVKLLNTF